MNGSEIEAEEDEPINPNSVSDPGEENDEPFSESETKSQNNSDFPSTLDESSVKPLSDYPPNPRY